VTRQTYNVAIVGATGAVGEVMREILEQRNFPVDNLYLLASERSAGTQLNFKNKSITVEDLADFDFSKADIALFSAGGSISREYAPKAAHADCVVIDNTSEFRYDDDIPLVVPEVNSAAIANYRSKRIIANPNCSTIQMLVALKPIYDSVGIEKINVATYQAVSGSGKSAIDELARQTAELMNGKEVTKKVYPHQIAFNVLPHIDTFQDNGYTREEMKMVWETHKIMGDDLIKVNPTAVRVPVFYGHSEAIHLETREKISTEQARAILAQADGITLLDDADQAVYAMPATDAAGKDEVWVSRVRQDVSSQYGLNLWVVSDNIRKGAALNSIQIAEELIKNYL
jgi:aspartate-semialdehyde dehydrogenase